MSGQNRKDPFHVNRDVVRDNLTVVRKVRLPRGSQIRVQRFFATAVTGDTISMPYMGNLHLSVSPAFAKVTINNPFVRNDTTRIALSSGQGTLVYTSPGVIDLTTSGPAGVYVVSVGPRNDRRNNGFAQ